MQYKILLTGASGTVGRHVLKMLCDNPTRYNVTIFDIKTKESQKVFKPYKNDINIIYGDISNKNDISQIKGSFDFVIHLAAIIPPLADENPTLTFNVNVIGTCFLLEHITTISKNAFFLYISSISIYGDRVKTPFITKDDNLTPSPGDKYAISKLICEDFVKESSIDWSIFRLTAVMGGHKISRLMFHMPLNTALEIITPNDTARAIVNSFEKREELNRRIFNMSGGRYCRTTYDEFLKISFKTAGLGKLNFPDMCFAEKNFHCGYYEDGDELEKILCFRKETLQHYYLNERKAIPFSKKIITILLRNFIKWFLKRRSEPYAAFRSNNKKRMERYFDIN